VLTPSRRIETRVSHDTFAFNERFGWVWLQKLCFGILKWLKAFELIHVETVTYGPFDTAKLKDEIFRTTHAVVDWRDFDANNYVIVMGSKQFRELVQDKEVHEALNFTVPLRVNTPYYERVFGFRCAVYPWLDGFALIPRHLVRAVEKT
jgi:hypothetical protein